MRRHPLEHPIPKLRRRVTGAAASRAPQPPPTSAAFQSLGGAVASEPQRSALSASPAETSVQKGAEGCGGVRGSGGNPEERPSQPPAVGARGEWRGAPSPSPGSGDVRREQGGVTIPQRSGCTTEPSVEGGPAAAEDLATEGSPRPPSPRPGAELGGTAGSGRQAGERARSIRPPLHPAGVGDRRGVWGWSRGKGGPSLAPPPRTWSRPKCYTFSLSEQLRGFLGFGLRRRRCRPWRTQEERWLRPT